MVKSETPEFYLQNLRKGEARKLKVVFDALEKKLQESTLDPRSKAAIAEKLEPMFKTRDPREIPNPSRLLTFTPVEASILFSWNAPKLLEVFHADVSDTDVPIVDLVSDLQKANGVLEGPKQVRCGLDLQNGYFLRKETPLYTGQAQVLCTLLNKIARGQEHPTKFSYQGLNFNIQTGKDLLDALFSSGHNVVMAQERMYADFLSLSEPGISLAWPSWVDTGLDNHQGGTICLPITHCQYTWTIQGPLVNTKIAFYLGTKGVSFIPEVYDTIDWKFCRIFQQFDSNFNQAEVYKSLDLAILFTKDVTTTLNGVANDGYGFSGVCTDSAAFIEMGLTGTLSVYPLLRNTSLSTIPKTADIAAISNKIPLDTDLTANAEEAVGRMLTSHPDENSWSRIATLIGPRLKSDLEALKAWNK